MFVAINFPETHIDLAKKRLKEFRVEIKKPLESLSKTGTTVIGILSPDRQIGIIASDGRMTMGSSKVKGNFEKIFDCRIGFIGVAGVVMVAQQILPLYISELDRVSDIRGVAMTPAGAIRRLFQYYLHTMPALSDYEQIVSIEFIALFWGKEGCSLYKIQGGCFVNEDNGFTSIGSGSVEVNPIMRRQFKNGALPNTKADLILTARELIKVAAEQDTATGDAFCYGIINKGDFCFGMEAL
jgi:20S proteasome alpha/beta subunit